MFQQSVNLTSPDPQCKDISATQPQVNTGHGHHSGHYYQQPQAPDPRYLGSPAQSSHYRSSPSSSSADPTRTQVRRFDVPAPQGSPYYQQPHANADLHMSSIQSDIRSPHMYPSPTANYPQYQHLQASAHHSSNSSRPIPAPPQYYHEPGMPVYSSVVGRTMPSSRSTQPYPRSAPPPSPVEDDLSARSAADSIIKKKRKRADAHQLSVLNATYERTAFPSTEERAALAKQLDMSPRSVQIWLVHPFCHTLLSVSDPIDCDFRFQNKRQAMRQGGRATTSSTNPAPNPGPVPVPTPTPPAGIRYHAASPAIMSPTVQQSGPRYTSRSPPQAQVMRTGQTPPTPGRPWGRSYKTASCL